MGQSKRDKYISEYTHVPWRSEISWVIQRRIQQDFSTEKSHFQSKWLVLNLSQDIGSDSQTIVNMRIVNCPHNWRCLVTVVAVAVAADIVFVTVAGFKCCYDAQLHNQAPPATAMRVIHHSEVHLCLGISPMTQVYLRVHHQLCGKPKKKKKTIYLFDNIISRKTVLLTLRAGCACLYVSVYACVTVLHAIYDSVANV